MRFDGQLKDAVSDSIIDGSKALFVFMQYLLLLFTFGDIPDNTQYPVSTMPD
jgi:hypothetical protein